MNSAHHTIAALVVAAVLLAKVGGTRWVAAVKWLLSAVGISKGGGAGERENNPELSVAISTCLLIGPTSYAMREREEYVAAFSAPDEVAKWLADEAEAVAAAGDAEADAKAAKAAAKAAKKEAKVAKKEAKAAAKEAALAPEDDAEAGKAVAPPPPPPAAKAEEVEKPKKKKKGKKGEEPASPREPGKSTVAESLSVEDF